MEIEENIVATVIVHGNYSDEVWQEHIKQGKKVFINIIGQYSDQGEKTVSIDIVNEYVLTGDTRSSNAIIDFNNLCIFRLDKNSTMVKIVREDENSFTLKGSQMIDPYSDSKEQNNVNLRVVFQVNNLDMEKPHRFNDISFNVKLSDPISQNIKDELATNSIILNGKNWGNFVIDGDCIFNIHSEDINTSFYGRSERGFIIKKTKS